MSEGDGDIFGYSLNALDLFGELGNRLQECCAVEVLQSAAQVVGDAGVAADHNHRAGRLEGVCDAGNGVGYAGAGGNDSHAGLAGDLRPAFGGVGGNLFVAKVDDLDAFVHAALIEVVDMPAVQREDILYALSLQCLGEQPSAVYLCHCSSSDNRSVPFGAASQLSRRALGVH